MAPSPDQQNSPIEVEENESCTKRKRSRRVSFAETTIHIFHPDEESEPSDQKVTADDSIQLGFSNDINLCSSSSPLSPEDENFFGPVSTSFINSVQEMESGLEDFDNHDITLDSTAFSLHFRNIAVADDRSVSSAGSLRTPRGDSEFLGLKDRIEEIGSGCSVSDHFVGGSRSYDYGKLSFTLETLLNEVNLRILQGEKVNEMFSAVSVDRFGKGDSVHPELQNSKLLSPSYGDLQNDLNGKGCCVQKEDIGRIENEEKRDFDSFLQSNAKSRMQFGHCPESSSKDLFVTALRSSPIDVSYDRSKKDGGISGVNPDENEENVAKHSDGMSIIKDLNCSGKSTPIDVSYDCSKKDGGIYVVNPDATEANVAKHSEGMKDLNCSGNVDHLTKNDKKDATLESMDISMVTPDNVFKSFQFPTLKGSISSYYDKRRHLKYPSFVSQSESLHGSAMELSTSLKMELKEHDERISAIKSSITRSRSKSRMEADCASTPSMKNLFITNYQDSFSKANFDSYLKNSRISDMNVDAKKVTAAMHLEDLDHFNKIDQREAGVIESNKDISNKEKSALSSEGFVTSGVDEKNTSSEIVEPKSLQPATSFEGSIENDLAEKIVQSPNNQSLNEIDLVSSKNSQASLTSFHGLGHQNTESQQEANCGYDVRVIGDTRNNQTCNIENDNRMQISSVTQSEALVDSAIMSFDPNHQDMALDMIGKARLKHLVDIDVLENLLDELQTARKYQGLCTALNNKHCSHDLQKKRVIEGRSLLEMLVIAKARKQLKCLKLKILHSKAQILQSKLEECGELKSTYAHLRGLCTRVTESDESSFSKDRLDEMKLEEQNRLTAMKQELGTLEHNIKVLLNSFEASCKLTEKTSSVDAIKAVEEHVMSRALCKQIQQHAQLGKVCDVVVGNDHYDIILGYSNLLFQRFTIKKSRFSNIVASIFPNAANITKKYPNLNAFMAFEFVFNFNVDQKLANSTCIYGMTMETNLLIGTLIDVLEEILLSRVELLNLTFSNFVKQPTGELELQICFNGSSSNSKITLGIDMSILNCGIYPSDPSELKIGVCEQQTNLPLSIVSMVIDSVRGLECGHLMILRLCRRVSQVIQCSS